MKSEKIAGIFIDPDRRLVERKTFTNNLEGYYKLLECECIDRVSLDPENPGDDEEDVEQHNDLVVDDEGIFKNPDVFFSIGGVEGYFVGKAVIVGVDIDEGEWVDTTLDINKLRVKFYNKKEYETENDKN